MKIGILGTRGIPNNYGGFEQFAEYFSVFLAEKNHEVYVYNSSNHSFKEPTFKGVHIIECYDPEDKIGTAGQFIYDYNCILDARKRGFDVLLQLGYTSSSIWHKLLPKNTTVITNMDGLEWKRTKYGKSKKKFLKYAERLAVKSSNFLISDSPAIQSYLEGKYKVKSKFIAYGAQLFENQDAEVIKKYDVVPGNYNMLIARLEPENNIETILDGVLLSQNKTPFLVIGNHHKNKFGAYLKNKFKPFKNIKFIGGVYHLNDLNNLRCFSNLYFHGHSVGGTNPSLLEAMASKALIVAHNNDFNKTILTEDAFYFQNKEDVANYISSLKKEAYNHKIKSNFEKIKMRYQWYHINNEYLDFFNECINY